MEVSDECNSELGRFEGFDTSIHNRSFGARDYAGT
jgi:hypothetical protein